MIKLSETNPQNLIARQKKILIIRLDKIGDLVCSLPVDQILDQKIYQVSWLVNQGLEFVVNHATPKRNFFSVNKKKSWTAFNKLLSHLKNNEYSTAISLQAPWWVSLALFLARVPVRAGVYSQWHSFLFLNRGIRQKRSLAEKHETEYNLEVLCHALNIPKPNQCPMLHLETNPADSILKKWNLNNKDYMVVHPGMAGSAKNWAAQNYSDLIEALGKKITIVLTGTFSDRQWTQKIIHDFSGQDFFINLCEQLDPVELLGILSGAKKVFAPSTGVAHLAASLGIPTVCIFSPIRVQRAQRWAPRGEHVEIHTPPVHCPAHFHCLGEKCQYFDCMNQIKPANLN